MTQLRFLWVGKTQKGFVQEGLDHYLQRIRGFMPVEVIDVRPADHSGRDPAQALRIEGEALLKRLEGESAVVILDERGTQLTSPKLAERLKALREQGSATITFVVGGAYGLDAAVKARARLTLALSPLTFPHQLVRVILAEQVYRALTISAGQPYHHGGL